MLDTGLDALKTASQKVVYKAAEGTGKFIGNEIADKIIKPKHAIDENPINIEETIIPPEKKRRNIKIIKTSIIKIEHYKISKLLSDSPVSKFATKNVSK